MDVSIIIVNWNTREITRQCLRSIYEQTAGITFEVVVVDNASEDGSVEMICSDFPQAILIKNTVNKGFAAANNQGMAVTKGRYTLLLNSDTLVLDNAIAKSIAFADQHPEAAVVGCRVLNLDKTLQPTCFMFPSLLNMVLSSIYLYKLYPRSRFFGREKMTWWDRSDIREVDVVTGCFMLVRKEAIDQVGMMDEDFFMYGEETDWCYRFRQAGWQRLYAPVAQIIHLGGQSSAKVRGEMLVQLRVSIIKFMKKHYGYLSSIFSGLLTVLFFAFRLPIWIFVAVSNGKQREQAMVRVRAYWSGIFKILLFKV